MSTSFHCHAVIGSKVSRDKLFVKEKVRSCFCSIPSECEKTFTYCPSCGKPIWIEVESRLFDEEWLLDGLQIVSSTDNQEYFVCYYNATSWASKDCQMTNLIKSIDVLQCMTVVKAALSKIGAWDESKFGLWAVPYISY